MADTGESREFLIQQSGDEASAEEASDEEPAPQIVYIWRSYRLKVAFICQYGLLCSFASQSIMGASLLTMVRHKEDVNSSLHNDPSPSLLGMHIQWWYNWGENKEAWILFAYFVGYYVMQIPSGVLTLKLGARRLVLVGTTLLAFLQLLTVGAALLGYPYFVLVTALAGATNSCLYSPIMSILAEWIPPQESSRLTALASSGVGLGVAVVFGLSAATNNIDVIGGWPFNFIALCVMLLLFTLLWYVQVTDYPHQCARLTQLELSFIDYSFSSRGVPHTTRNHTRQRVPSLRVCARIMVSGPVLAVAASQFGTDWVQYFLITLFSQYLQHTRGMRVSHADFLCGLPWLAVPISSYAASQLVDLLRKRGCMSTTKLRIIADFCAKVVPGGILVAIANLPNDSPTCDMLLALLYVLALLFVGFEGSSWLANILELSPHFASFVSAYSQVLSLPGSFVLPLVVGAITNEYSETGWEIVMYVNSGILAVTWLVYACFCSTDPQHWTDTAPPSGDPDRERENTRRVPTTPGVENRGFVHDASG